MAVVVAFVSEAYEVLAQNFRIFGLRFKSREAAGVFFWFGFWT